MAHYPPARDYRNSAKIYGTLPDHGQEHVCLVYHTTETRGMPGFKEGATAPHYVYRAKERVWDMWAEYEDGYVGTLKGHSTAGHGNCKAFQVEIIAYSNKTQADKYEDAIWVGDFTDEHYQDLADFYAWARDRYGISLSFTPTPPTGWKYGTSSPHRMSVEDWEAFDGLTAHGAVPGNTHWDTGVLDMEKIWSMSLDQCPWTEHDYPACEAHYFWPETTLQKGIAKGQHQGSCNIPTWAENGINWAFESKMYMEGNAYRYDFQTLLSEGRYTILEFRRHNAGT